MTPNLQIPATLRPSCARIAFLFVTSLMFVLGGIWMVGEGESEGYFVTGFFAIGLAVALIQLHPRAAYLRLTSDGFTFCGLFRTHTVRWAEVLEFGVIRINIWMVAWNPKAGHSRPGRVRALARRLWGYEAALPDTYGMKPRELAELMETLRQKYAPTQDA